jgi:hypothetical protein
MEIRNHDNEDEEGKEKRKKKKQAPDNKTLQETPHPKSEGADTKSKTLPKKKKKKTKGKPPPEADLEDDDSRAGVVILLSRGGVTAAADCECGVPLEGIRSSPKKAVGGSRGEGERAREEAKMLAVTRWRTDGGKEAGGWTRMSSGGCGSVGVPRRGGDGGEKKRRCVVGEILHGIGCVGWVVAIKGLRISWYMWHVSGPRPFFVFFLFFSPAP